MANSSSELGSNVITSSLLSEASATIADTSTEPSVNLLTVHNQNGQYIIQQPLRAVNNGLTLVGNGGALSKGHIIGKQKPLSLYQQMSASAAAAMLGDKNAVERIGVKRPLTSSGGNVITKVIIAKNLFSGQTQAYPVGLSSQECALTSVSGDGNFNIGSNGSQQQVCSSTQHTASTNTVMVTSKGALSPVKTVISNISSAGTSTFSVPYHKIPTSPAKTPAKITMIPVLGTHNKESLSSNITELSHVLNTVSQSGCVPLKPGSTSKVIIKQGPAPTGSSLFTLKGQSLSTLTAQSIRVPHVVQNVTTSQVVQNMQPVTINNAGSTQQFQVPGSRFQYLRLVSPSSNFEVTTPAAKSHAKETTQVVHAARNVLPLTVAPVSSANHVKITLPFQQQNTPLAPKPAAIPVSVSSQQGVFHIILPATSSAVTAQSNTVTTLVPIQPAPSAPVTSVPNVNQLPSGAAILSASNSNIQGLQGFALVPASDVAQFQQQQLNKSLVTQATTAPPAVPRQTRDYVPIASIDPAITQYTVSRNAPSNNGPTLEATGARPRKPCNCTKSQCLKLYCDCFANGEFCQNCNCNNCANNLEHEEDRSKAIKSCLDRNPQAFHPKIGKSKEIEGSRRHTKGCNCKRSGCLKNYCECYEAKIMCSNFCKCIGCKNFEESPERKTLMHLADAAEVRVQQQTAAKTKLSSQISCVPSRPPVATANGERLPFALITTDVAEATSACLLAQAEEAERMKMPPVVQERMIIEEFGRCLMQIIESANRTRTASSVA